MKRLVAAMIAASAVGAIGSVAADTRTDTITYDNNTTHWVIGQTKKATNVDTGLVESEVVYNALAQPVTVYNFGKLKYTLTYEADGDVSTVSDGGDGAVNKTVTFSSWKREIPQLISFPDATTRSAKVTDLGTMEWSVDQLKAKTCYSFDEMGRLSRIVYPSEVAALDGTGTFPCNSDKWSELDRTFEQVATAENGLSANHWRELITTGDSRKYVYYDALWRPVLTKTYDALDFNNTLSQTVTRYDSDGRSVFQSYPTRTAVSDFATAALDGTRTTYDVLGRPLRTEQDAESIFTNSVVATVNAYETGFVTRTTNARGNATLTQFQTFDQPTTDAPVYIQHPGGAYTDIDRDIFGKPEILTRRDAATNSISRKYTYNTYQELCRVFEPETENTFLGYDLAGNLEWSASGYTTTAIGCLAKTSVAARRADRAYDSLNRITSLTFADGKGDTTYTYHPDGQQNVLTVDNGDGNIVSTTYAYNRRRLLTSERMDWNAIHWTVSYGYSENGFLASQFYPGLGSVTYAPNALGQPTQAGTYATGVTYHPNGGMKSFTYGNGIVHSLDQNERQLPLRSRDLNGTTAILDDSYDYDANGNVAGISDATVNNRGDRDMTYDSLDRLTSMYAPAMLGGSGYIYYGYDVLDNIVSISTASRSHRYCYDTSNRLTFIRAGATVACSTGAAVIAFGYDAQGNLAFKNNVNYQFDMGNRLRSTTVGALSSYVYDALGRRVRDYTTASKYSLYTQAGQLAYTSDGRTSKNANYVYLNGSLVATSTVPFGGGTATVEYQHTDALGTPVAVTNASKAVIQRSEYEPYGAVLNRPMEDGVGFTGHVEDATTGLIYMQQRYYDPLVGRFLSVDPVAADGASGGNFNRYKYAGNSPLNFKDPDGRQECGACDRLSDAAASGALFVGRQLVDAGNERVRYTEEASKLPKDDKAGRSALKSESRAKTPSTVRAVVVASRPSTAPKAGSGGRANVTNAKVNAGAAQLKVAGKVMIAAAVAQQGYEIANSSDPARDVAGAGGMTVGAVGGGEGGASFGLSVGAFLGGPPGAAVGAIIGGLVGSALGGHYGEKSAEALYDEATGEN